MKNVTYAWFLLLLLALGGCQKETPGPAEPEDAYPFVAGDLLVGIRAGVPIGQVFQLANAKSFALGEMSGFYYTSSLPKDSLAYVLKVLSSKPYLNQRGFTGSAYINAMDGSFWEVSNLFNMDPASQQDWLATVPQLRLADAPNDTRYVLLKVPAGQEKFWRTELRKNDLVKWTQLNSIGALKII